MRFVLWTLALWALIAGIAVVVTASGTHLNVFAYIGPAIVIGAGLGSYGLRRRREKRERTDAADSVEAMVGERARAGAMVDGLVFTLVAGLLLLVDRDVLAPLLVYVAVIATVVDYNIRYGIILRRTRSGR